MRGEASHAIAFHNSIFLLLACSPSISSSIFQFRAASDGLSCFEKMKESKERTKRERLDG